MGLKWLVVLLGAFALIHFTISEEEIPEVEEVEEAEERVRVRRQSTCTDKLDYCQSWPDKYCQDYYDYMKTNCPKKCGHCTGPTSAPVCQDKSSNCPGWKQNGFCSTSSQWYSYMKANCAKTCGICGGGGGGGGGGGSGSGSCSGAASGSGKISTCNFDSSSENCVWTDIPFDDHIDFQEVSGSSSGGPSSGHGGSGGYLIARGNSGNKAQLLLPLEIVLPHQDTSTIMMCLRFQHSVSSGGSLKVYQIENKRGQPSSLLKAISGGSDSNWKCGTQAVKVSTLYQIMIEATVGSGPVALDAISFATGSC